jgi:hypothetical protein
LTSSLSLSASRIAPGERSVTSSSVETIWSTRRSPLFGPAGRGFSVTVMKPLVMIRMSPLPWTSTYATTLIRVAPGAES